MAQLFDDVFNPQGIYETFFFNIKSVLLHPTLKEFQTNDKNLYERWKSLSRSKYKYDVDLEHKDIVDPIAHAEKFYSENAVYYPEFTKIVAITYATVYIEDGTVKRHMKKIVNEDEFIVLATFMEELFQLSRDGAQSSPQFFPTLCGHNIISHDMPHLIKKFIYYRDRFETNKNIPLILKRSLGVKPWESGVVDTINVWKFNGYDNMPLMLISDYLGLKKTVNLFPLHKVSETYWEMVKDDTEKALEFVSLQSATQTNLVIQLINTLRVL